MRRIISGIAFACLFIFTPVASAYPPAVITDVGQTAVTVRGLDCGTQYRIQLEERNAANTGWESLSTFTPTTSACPVGTLPPTAAFTISPDPAVRNQPTTFRSTGSCPQSPCSFVWLQGSATSTDQIGTGATASYVFKGATGTRTVTLRVTDAGGRVATATRTIQVVRRASDALASTALAESATAYPPATIGGITQNTLTVSGLDCGTQYRFQIEERDPLTAAWGSLTTQTVTTAACAAAPPVAGFGVAPDPAVRNLATAFTSTGTCAAAPCTYRWLHGDATSTDQIGTGPAAAFTYTGAAGPRTVTLRVTDAQSREAVLTKTFQLVDAPPPPPPTPQCSDGVDNDLDGATDYPADTGCSSAIDDDESSIASPPTGFPDASNTGVPAGVTLTPSGGLTIGVAGTVIDAREITGQVVVNAPNVTIRRSRIRSNSMWVIDNNSTGLVVEDSEIVNRPVAGQNNCHNGIGDGNFTVRRSEITGCENAANIGGDNVTFVDNYVHDLDTVGPSYVWGNDPHTDGLQLSPGADNLVIRHNWIDPSPGGGVTAPIIMGVNGSQANVWIEDNYLDGRGASYALYANRSPSTNVNINRNRMYRGANQTYTACVRLGVTVTTFNENRDAGTGALLSPDNGAGGGCTN